MAIENENEKGAEQLEKQQKQFNDRIVTVRNSIRNKLQETRKKEGLEEGNNSVERENPWKLLFNDINYHQGMSSLTEELVMDFEKRFQELSDNSVGMKNEATSENTKEKIANDFSKEIQEMEVLDVKLQEKQRSLDDIDEQIEELLGQGKNIQLDIDQLEERMGTIPEKEWFEALRDVENINHDIKTKHRRKSEIEKEVNTLHSQVLERFEKIPEEKKQELKLRESLFSIRIFGEHKEKKVNKNEDMENFLREKGEQLPSGESQKKQVNEKSNPQEEEIVLSSHDTQEGKKHEELREKMSDAMQELAKKKTERERFVEEKRELEDRSRKYGIELNEDFDNIEKQIEIIEKDIQKQEEFVQVMQKEFEGGFVNNSGGTPNDFEKETLSQSSGETEKTQEEEKESKESEILEGEYIPKNKVSGSSEREERVVINGEYSRVDDKEETNSSQKSEKGEQRFSPEEFSNRKQRIEDIQKKIDGYEEEKNKLQKELNLLGGEQKEIEAELSSLEGGMKQEERGGKTVYRGTLSVGEIEELKKRRDENNRKIQEKKASIEVIQISIQNAQDEQKALKEKFIADFDMYAGRVSPGEEAQTLLDFFEDAERYRKELDGSLDILPKNVSENKEGPSEKTEEKPLSATDEKKNSEKGDEEGEFLRKLTKDLEDAREAFALDMKNPEKKKKYDEYLQNYNSEVAKRFSDYMEAKEFEQMMRANEIGEQIKIKEAIADDRLKDVSFMGKAKNMFMSGIEKYQKLPFKQKIALSVGLIGAGALGGAAVGATAIGMTAAGLGMRALSFTSSSVGFNTFFKDISEKLYSGADRERVDNARDSFGEIYGKKSEFYKENPLEKAKYIQNLLGQSSSQIADRIEKRNYRDKYLRWTGSVGSALALTMASRCLGEAAASKIGEWFSDAPTLKISPEYIQTPPSDPITGGGMALDDASWNNDSDFPNGGDDGGQSSFTPETSQGVSSETIPGGGVSLDESSWEQNLSDKSPDMEKTFETVEMKMSPEEYAKAHPELFKSLEGRVWMDNDTQLRVGTDGMITGADRNELSLRWGGGGDGVDARGNYVFSVAKMTSDGSFHKGLSEDAIKAIQSGELKMIFTLNENLQGQYIEVPVESNGNIIIDPQSSAGKILFSQNGGRSVFLGHTAEVGIFGDDGKFTVLATHKGNGLESIMESVQNEIPEEVTSNITTETALPEDLSIKPSPEIPEKMHFEESRFFGEDMQHRVKSGDRIWNILGERTENFFSDRPDISSEQRKIFIDSLKDSLENMKPEELKAGGISSGNIDRIFAGRDTIDFSKLLDDEDYLRAIKQSGITLEAQETMASEIPSQIEVTPEITEAPATSSEEVLQAQPEMVTEEFPSETATEEVLETAEETIPQDVETSPIPETLPKEEIPSETDIEEILETVEETTPQDVETSPIPETLPTPEILSIGESRPFGELIGEGPITEQGLKSLGSVGEDIWKYVSTSLERNYLDVQNSTIQDTLKALEVQRLSDGSISLVSEGETSFLEVMREFPKDALAFDRYEEFFDSISDKDRNDISLIVEQNINDPSKFEKNLRSIFSFNGVSENKIEELLRSRIGESREQFFQRTVTQIAMLKNISK
ncbi:MAG: hypothetical protein IPN70_03475 [Candidatus Moraniibacteriota bacterium]|nr:MAG: hypothetical protein IPN70_03475 [Candidatus Moranbacteria bacterium]